MSRWGQAPQQQQQVLQQHSFYSRTFSLPAVDGRLPEILFSGGEHIEAGGEVSVLRGPPSSANSSSSNAAEDQRDGAKKAAATRTPVKHDAAAAERKPPAEEAALGRPTAERLEGGGGELDGYKCPRCAKLFASFDQVKEHMATVHRDGSSRSSSTTTTTAARTIVFKYRKGELK
jgi:hypothetical protein